jgi:creatinine amidohydrolase
MPDTTRSMTSPPVLPASVTTDPENLDAAAALLPIGSFEQHGPHLPLVTDTLVAIAIASAIAQRHPARMLPPVTIASSHEHAAFPGTVSLTATTLAAVVGDVIASLRHQRIDRVMLVNGHGGNYVLSNITQQANLGPSRVALYPARADWEDAREAAGMTTTMHEDMHAGELETSILLAMFPEYLRDGWQDDDHTAGDRRDFLTLGMSGYTSNGVIGRPSLATAAKGHAALDTLTTNGERALKALIALPST